MSQQTPPNVPGNQDDHAYASQSPSFAQEGGQGANPYFGQRSAAPPPDLDSGSPTLTSAEAKQLNRKALLFLAGIVLMLLLLGYFVLWGGKDEPDPEPRRASADQMTVPNAPTTPPPDLPPTPVEDDFAAMQADPVPLLPPVDPDMGSTRSVGASDGVSGPRPPSLMDRRMASAGGQMRSQAQGAESAAGSPNPEVQQMLNMQAAMLGLPPGGPAAPTVAMAQTNAQFLSNPSALLIRGTYLRCVLESRIITDVPGYTSCILTEPVYSVNGKQLLLPKGSKILGKYKRPEDGVARVEVIWDRVVTPTGLDVTMASPGVDGLGGAGHPGDYDGHWAQKITSALLISLISDGFQWAAAEHGPRSSTVIAGPTGGATVIDQPFESATARSMEQLANEALRKSAARPGTVTINHGTVVNVYVAQDVDFSSVLAAR